MYGFKAFDKDLKCRDFQFKVGKIYKIKGKLSMCNNGFHFCKIIDNVFNYYDKDSRVCLVRGIGEFIEDGSDKVCFESIEIIKELTEEEIKNTLTKNNSGNYNSGDYNSGDYNSGNYNSGDYNSGNYNSGNYNSGNYNSGNYNSGFFNTDEPTVRLFNKDSSLNFDDPIISQLKKINVKPILRWIPEDIMTDEEKQNNLHYKTTKGYLKNTGKNDWSQLSKNELDFIKSLPNFDAEIFKEITGLDLSKPKTIKVNHDGKEFEIDIEKAKELGIIKE